MTKPDQITPLILTFNEAPNIGGLLEQLWWAERIVVVDSLSTDQTRDIATSFKNVEVQLRPFDSHASQWNFGLQQIDTDWVLTMDADYRCPPELVDEIRGLDGDCDAYVASFTYCIDGKPLRGGLYPPRAVLFRPQRCHYVQDGHTQLLVHDPKRTRYLRTKLLHDDRKSLSRWLAAQSRYSKLEAEKLMTVPKTELGLKNRLRHWHVVMPPLMLFYGLFDRGLILDGPAGWYYALQRSYTELLLSLNLLERKLRPASRHTSEPHRTLDVQHDEPAAVESA